MSAYAWKDVTSYSQGTKTREPRTWELSGRGVSITVTRRIHEDGWFLLCENAGITNPQPVGDDLDKAKARAIGLVYSKLSAMLAVVDGMAAR